MIEITEDNLPQLVKDNEMVMVQYGATWCGNCKLVKPKFKRLSGENEDIKFYYVDAEKYPDSRKMAEVTNLPTFAAFKGGSLIKQAQGNKEDIIKELINEITNN